jgi:hypothetical protein
MINKRCPREECRSTHTYAVPSRAKTKVGEDGKVVLDEVTGEPVKIMCRRCRNCGRDYFDEGNDNRVSSLPKDPTMRKNIEDIQKRYGIVTK